MMKIFGGKLRLIAASLGTANFDRSWRLLPADLPDKSSSLAAIATEPPALTIA